MATLTSRAGSLASRFIQLRYESDVTGWPSAMDILGTEKEKTENNASYVVKNKSERNLVHVH